jgi:DNA invertase Pin-like site-specific DNA recombinase
MDGMKYGYARVWTDDQTPALQLAALKKAGRKTIFKDDGLSGATTKRSALLHCLKKLEHGDTLTVWKLDRLGRSGVATVSVFLAVGSSLDRESIAGWNGFTRIRCGEWW